MENKINIIIDDNLEVTNNFPKIYIHPFFSKLKNEKDSKILDYHWNDYDKLKKDNVYINEIQSKLIISVSNYLNQFHNKKNSQRFWEIVIGKWIHNYCVMMFTRWEILTKLNEINGNFLISTKKFLDKDMIFQSTDELNTMFFLNDYNSYLFSTILNYRFSSDKKFTLKNHNDISSEFLFFRKKFSKFNDNIKTKIKNIYNILFSKKLRKQKYAILRSYLGVKDDFKLNIKLLQLPTFIPNNYLNCEPDLVLRNQISLNAKSQNEFENFLYKKIFLFMPVSYLEGFKIEEKKIKELSLPNQPKKIFSSNILNKSLLSRYCAEKVENGSQLILGVHGGSYGHYDIHFNFNHEINISDLYLTWGGKNIKNSKVKPFGIIRPLPNYKKKQNQKLLTMIIPCVDLFKPYMESDISMIHNKNYIFNPCFKIIDNLNESIKLNNLLIRCEERNFGQNEYKTFEEKYPNIKKDNRKINYNDLLSNTRIFLSPYLGTGFLETLAMNIPTLVFTAKKNSNIINDEAKKFYEILKKSKVFFDDETELSNHINQIWNDHYSWWNSSEVQKAVKIFCNEYAYKNNNKIEDLKKILLN